MRGGNHSKDIREYVITDKGVMIIGQSQADYTGLTTGIPERVGKRVDAAPEPKATQ
jgi:circadian clock protein KaiC